MHGSWKITRVAGIDLSVHWTFLVLLGWVLVSATAGHGLLQGMVEVLFVLSIFSCVVLHELGHAMAARVFGVPTHGITLLPIGGVAQLDRIPRDPWQEWVIALAGPAVNVLIVGLLFPIVTLIQGVSAWSSPLAVGGNLLARLMWVNVMLVCFNLLPAFPMDGGRLLRSWLALRTDYVTATRWATRVGQGLALLLGTIGLFVTPMLLLIALFVWFAGESEYRVVRREGSQHGRRRAGEAGTLDWESARSAVPVMSAAAWRDTEESMPTAVPTAGTAGHPHLVELPWGVVIVRADACDR